jgi:hypothetical protein
MKEVMVFITSLRYVKIVERVDTTYELDGPKY